eukprot:2195202-Heterocapsa_arctica.AAC.1
MVLLLVVHVAARPPAGPAAGLPCPRCSPWRLMTQLPCGTWEWLGAPAPFPRQRFLVVEVPTPVALVEAVPGWADRAAAALLAWPRWRS